jgi:hypothetical protein
MDVKNAAIRGIRSLIQGTIIAGGVALAAAAKAGSFDAASGVVAPFLFAEALALGYAVISFLQNLVEDNTAIDVPKG